ncbi:MAG: hypothetical protein DGJ47_000104 [Rickettsiaceae bacterium]
MYSLKEIQSEILEFIFSQESKQLPPSLKNNSLGGAGVCRNNVISELINSLRSIYPGIWKLIGDKCANGVARGYIQDKKNLVSRGDLNIWGSGFPLFLKSFKSTKNLLYLSDFASLEFIKHQASIAKNTPFISFDDMQSALNSEIENIKINFTPSLFLLKTQWPVDILEQVLNDPSSKNINLSPKKRFILAFKSKNNIHTFYLEKDRWKIIKNLARRKTLSESIPLGMNESAVTNFLHFLLSNELISKVVT